MEKDSNYPSEDFNDFYDFLKASMDYNSVIYDDKDLRVLAEHLYSLYILRDTEFMESNNGTKERETSFMVAG